MTPAQHLRLRADTCWRRGLFDLAGSYHAQALIEEMKDAHGWTDWPPAGEAMPDRDSHDALLSQALIQTNT